MSDLKAQLQGELRSPSATDAPEYEYALVFPPGWRRFAVDDDAERAFVEQLMAAFARRTDVQQLTRFRAMMHKSFSELKRRGAVALHIPSEAVGDIPLPVSTVVLPAPVRSDADLAAFRSKAAARGPVASAQTEDGRTILRWEERASRAAGEDGATALTINWLFPAPLGSELRPAIVSSTILYPDGFERDELTLTLIELVDSIAGTFTWRPLA